MKMKDKLEIEKFDLLNYVRWRFGDGIETEYRSFAMYPYEIVDMMDDVHEHYVEQIEDALKRIKKK